MSENHEHNEHCNHEPVVNLDQFVDAPRPEFETKPFVASEELTQAVEETLQSIRDRSFSGRRPELGKMIKCQVCGLRHRSAVKCVQRFKELYIEEDLETGEKTTVYATTPQNTRNGVHGAPLRHNFAKPRYNPHLSRKKLLFVERVRQLFDERDFDPNTAPEVFQKTLELARKIARKQLRKEERQMVKHYRSKQHLSRRINRGLASPGSR